MRLRWDFDELWEFRDRLEQTEKFEKYAKQATRELAKVLQDMLFQYTPVRTGNLCASWGGAENMAYTVKRVPKGFEVTLTNSAANKKGDMYGEWVNDGHRSFNQFGGPYGFVPGKFFVEASVSATEPKAESVIYEQLKKWWEACLNG